MNMSVDVKYRTTATARVGPDGIVQAEDGTFEVKLATPKTV
jgi:lipoyl-dependent peroxiredoxin